MKTRITRYATKVTLFAAALVATGLLAASANAQSFHGKFTLPYQVQWGHATLPAGDYLLAFAAADEMPRVPVTPRILVIRDARSLRVVAFELTNSRDNSPGGGSALLIGTRGDRRIVHSLRIAQLGQIFIYDPALARQSEVEEEAWTTQIVPVLAAKK